MTAERGRGPSDRRALERLTMGVAGRFDEGVIGGRCGACGHDVSSVPPADLPAALRHAGRDWQLFLSTVCDHPGGRDGLRQRPEAEGWSAVEYGCHVRDVLALLTRGVELAVLVDRPDLDNWDHERVAVEDFYREQDPLAVADDLERGAVELARITQTLTTHALERRAACGGSVISVIDMVRCALHEAQHHLHDARSVVPATA